ncbi:MAG: hypothetical protein Q8L34_05230 [Candidatus Woesearchaeota archaeon]|nr:hypothetical protein [Candidatus Woesearchaeota archaeon]
MTRLDSDNGLETRGKVSSITRRDPKNNHSEQDLVALVLDTEQGTKTVDFPLITQSDFELIPYQHALVGQNVQYSKQWDGSGDETFRFWKLQVLSGPLAGNAYNASR